MTCEQAQSQLNLLADGELMPLAAWQTRRHLTRCPACAAQYAQIVQLGSDARTWRNAAPPAVLASRIAGALFPQTAPLEKTAMLLERPLPIADPPRRFGPRKARIGFALAACLAGVLTLAFWPSKQAHLPAAYADTVLAMQRVRSAAWTQTTTMYKPDGSIGLHQIVQTWVRRNPPAIAQFVPPDSAQHGVASSSRILKDARGLHILDLNDGKTALQPLRKPITEQVQDTLNNLTSNSATKGVPMKSSRSILVNTQTPWSQDRVTLNGHVLLRFRKDITAMFRGLPGSATQDPIVLHRTEWIDPETHRLQRIEWQYALPKIGDVDSTTNQFVYDQSAPAGVFDEAAYSAAPPARSVPKPAPLPAPGAAAWQDTYNAYMHGIPAAQLRTVTITGVYLPHSSLLPPRWHREHLEATTDVLLVVRDSRPDHAYREAMFLEHGASRNFVLTSPGHPDVPLTLDGASYGGNNAPNTQGFGARLTPQNKAKLAPGASYTLHPLNTNSTYRWTVAPGVTLTIPQ